MHLILRRSSSVLVLFLATCTSPPDPPGDSAAVPSAARVEPAVTVTTRPAASARREHPVIRPDPESPRHPPEPYVDEDVCPFECCIYREWIARGPLPAYRSERDTTVVAFTLARGERFEALTGSVHLDRVGVVAVRRPVTWREGPDSIGRFEPGDTVYVLSYLGEDHYRIWHRGRLIDGFRFWAYPEEPGQDRAEGDLLQEPREDWWAKVRTRRGETGWLHMNADGRNVGLKDACSVD